MEQRWSPAPEAVTEGRRATTPATSAFARAGFTSDSELFLETLPLTGDESLALAPSRITLLSDRGSWLNALLPDSDIALWQRGHAVRWIHLQHRYVTGMCAYC